MSHSSYHSMIVPPYPNQTCRTLHTVLYSATLYILAQVRHFQARFLNRSCPHKRLEKGWKTVFPNLSNLFSRWQFLSAFFDLDGRDQESSRTFQHKETLHFRAFARTSETTHLMAKVIANLSEQVKCWPHSWLVFHVFVNLPEGNLFMPAKKAVYTGSPLSGFPIVVLGRVVWFLPICHDLRLRCPGELHWQTWRRN